MVTYLFIAKYFFSNFLKMLQNFYYAKLIFLASSILYGVLYRWFFSDFSIILSTSPIAMDIIIIIIIVPNLGTFTHRI